MARGMRIPPQRAAKRQRMARDQQRRTGRRWVPRPERMSRNERRMAAFSERKALKQDQPAGGAG